LRNILILSTIYPNPYSRHDTGVVHYFAKEWHNLGYNILVIHYQSIFPRFFYWIANLMPEQVKKIIRTDFFQTKRRTKDVYYKKDDITIYSFPIYKLIPHGRYSSKTIFKHVEKVLSTLSNHNFVPDIITGHFYNPQIEIISNLKQRFSNARTCIVLHEDPEIIKIKYPNNYLELFKNIDVWGFRFLGLKEKFELIFGKELNTFICYSGIPEKYISSSISQKNFSHGVTKFCFIGMLIPLKRVNDSIIALDKAFANKNFEFTIIGEGMEMDNLKKLVSSLNLNHNISFTGKLDRDKVQEKLKEVDCFIMVSESEAFGLVYLEAMSKGCITIGAKGQGIDGIIVHGINGFLCESANPEKLADLLTHIQSLTVKQLAIISQNAIDTTVNMTDCKVAESYINNIAQ
jgi:glycosyltransferase involved in cell wall biosynthesis